MITATKEFSFDFAHMLAGHEGLCQNVHGHTYKLQVTVSRCDDAEGLITHGASEGMVIDFKHLKRIVNDVIVKKYDHSFVYWEQSTDVCEKAIVRVLKDYGKKVVGVNYRPTAEAMARDWFWLLDDALGEIDLNLVNIRLYETPTSYAEVN